MVALLAAAAVGGAYYALGGRDSRAPALAPGSTLEVAQLEPANRMPDFTLERAAGPLTAAGLRGRWTFVFFGYTNCPNACPATLGILNHVHESLRTAGVVPPRVLFISLDPQRDTPAVLQRYAAAFGDDVIGATGAADALRGLQDFFGVSAERRPGVDAASYTLDHTTNFFLVTPGGRWLATFAPAEDGDAVLADTRTLLALPQTD